MSLPQPPVRRRQRRLRRAITALCTAVTVTVLAGAAAAVPSPLAEPAAADTMTDVNDTLDPPDREGPFWQPLGEGAYLNFTVTYGEDARVGPDTAGDGWYVHATERRNVVDFYGLTPYGSHSGHVELYVVAGGGSPQPSDLRRQYDPYVCNCAMGVPPHAVSWQGLDGGALWARITFVAASPPYERDTGFVRVWPAGCRCVLPSVRTPQQIENMAPVSSVFAPANGAVVHRSTPEHRQEFSALFGDVEHHNITGFLEVVGPIGVGPPDKITFAGTVKRHRRHPTGSGTLTPVRTPLRLPRRRSSYRTATARTRSVCRLVTPADARPRSDHRRRRPRSSTSGTCRRSSRRRRCHRPERRFPPTPPWRSSPKPLTRRTTTSR